MQTDTNSDVSASQVIRIGVFGHYGNNNLGDESIIEAVISNLRSALPDAEIRCLSINPFDSAERHGVKAFPIRYRSDYFQGPAQDGAALNGAAASSAQAASQEALTSAKPDATASGPATHSWKARLKAVPVLGHGIKAAVRVLDYNRAFRQEARFLGSVKNCLEDLDLLLVTGSNQFLDNFGGPWGFPYTLLKWTILAKQTNTKVAFISVGAGPLTHPLSFWMLRQTLKRADFLSFRDQGSLDLIRDKTGIVGSIYPDLAHSLTYRPVRKATTEEHGLHIAINPMPVFDSRYWHNADESKYREYVRKVTALCRKILSDGSHLTLFSTQLKDENVIEDILEELGQDPSIEHWREQISVARNRSVAELMDTLMSADVIVATRFHATVLPLQLGKPVLGICYYRKAAELLDDVGLNDFYVYIDDFEEQELLDKYQDLVRRFQGGQIKLNEELSRYRESLAEQYRGIVRLVVPEEKG